MKRDFSKNEVDWSGLLFLYFALVIFLVPAILIGFAYVRTATELVRSIRKANQLKSDSKCVLHSTSDVTYYLVWSSLQQRQSEEVEQ